MQDFQQMYSAHQFQNPQGFGGNAYGMGGMGMNGGLSMNGGMGNLGGGMGNNAMHNNGGYRDFGKGRGKGKGKGGKGKGKGGKSNQRMIASVPLFEEGTKVEEITATSFEELGIAPRLCELLARNGFLAPFPIQSLCIPEALAGKDVCGKAKTGSGKTLAFGLPLLQMLQPTREKGFPSALILVPTRELALQVHQVLSTLRGPLIVEVAYGGSENRKFQINALMRKPVDILAACPGRLIDFCEAGIISLSRISHLVLDEADRMAEMGFQEQVDDILRRIGDDNPRQTMLFSATLDSSVDQLVKRHMTQPVHHQVAEKSVTVDQMTHRFIQVGLGRDKMAICAALCCLPGLEKVLVFVRTKMGVDDLTAALKHNYRIRALAIHGDKTQTARERTLQAFDKGDLHVLVATDVAARGLDIRRVDFVINYDAPEGVDGHKIYLHRSGRTARAGKTGLVATLAARGDQEQDVEVIRRRLNIRDPVHRVTPKDAANLAEILGLVDFLTEFNEGRRPDPRIEASRQRILREIEEGGPFHMGGMGGMGMGTTSGGRGYSDGGKGKGKGKGMQGGFGSSFGLQQPQQPQYNGFQDARADFGAFNPNAQADYNQNTNTGGPASFMANGVGKGQMKGNGPALPAFNPYSAAGRGNGGAANISIGAPYSSPETSTQVAAPNSLAHSFGNALAQVGGRGNAAFGPSGGGSGGHGSFGSQAAGPANNFTAALAGTAYDANTTANYASAIGPSYGMTNAQAYGAAAPSFGPGAFAAGNGTSNFGASTNKPYSLTASTLPMAMGVGMAGY